MAFAPETAENKPRFAARRMVPRVNGEEIQALVREPLVEKWWLKPTVGKGIAFWM